MKNLLSLLGAVTLVASSSATVIACGDTKPEKDKIINDLIKKFEKDINKIFAEHLEKNVYQNLINLPATEINNQFLNKETINKYQGKSFDQIGEYQLNQLSSDIIRVLDIKNLEKSLNELKAINEYKIILSDVKNLYKGIVFDWKTLKINSNNSQQMYLGNVVLDYKIEIQYKGKKEVETLSIGDTLKYTSTDNDALKTSTDTFYRNIASDYLASKVQDDIKQTNLKWKDIMGSKKVSDGYGKIDRELANYYDLDRKNNGFEKSIISFVKSKYFYVLDSLPIVFEEESIFKGAELNETSLLTSTNKIKSGINEEAAKYDYSDLNGQVMMKTIFRNNPETSNAKQALRNQYFVKKNKDIWNRDFNFLKEDFLKNLNGNFVDYKNSAEYKSSIAMGYINLKGLSINLGSNAYIHQLPDFKIAVNYMIDLSENEDKTLDDMSEFSVKTIKAFHETFGVNYDYEYVPEANSDDDILMALKSSEFTNKLKFDYFENYGCSKNLSYQLSLTNELTNLESYRESMFDLANLSSDTMFQFSQRSTEWNGEYNFLEESNYFKHYDEQKGISISRNNIFPMIPGVVYQTSTIYWSFGYLNFYINLNNLFYSVPMQPSLKKDLIVFS
ncbi:lipoprotein [Spiroplasma cantharicola]|uniref:Lipoprotein n=1 Tax=Spiroplasma cantharicola TaxID=362837 RepID=A0A0M4K1N8_9MOLU|nr:lipoprotein [Spiroplasma cantharicola]ALD66550.1 hypothetical protein SCANT_v1c06440 [Spiroplasma cantharicola]